MILDTDFGGVRLAIDDDGVIRYGGLVGKLTGDLTDGTLILGGVTGTISGGQISWGGLKGFIVDDVIHLGGLVSQGSSGPVPPSGDPYFAFVKALLHFDTPGNSYTDVKGHTVTRVGTSTATATGALIGPASMRIPNDTSGCVLNGTDLALGAPGTPMTLELRFKLDALPPADPGYAMLLMQGLTDTDANGIQFYLLFGGSAQIDLPGGGSLSTEDNVFQAGVDTYLALVRTAIGHWELWLNGAMVDFAVNTNAPSVGDVKLRVGCGADAVTYLASAGLYDELRLTVGVARDVSVVPTEPFPDFGP